MAENSNKKRLDREVNEMSSRQMCYNENAGNVITFFEDMVKYNYRNLSVSSCNTYL